MKTVKFVRHTVENRIDALKKFTQYSSLDADMQYVAIKNRKKFEKEMDLLVETRRNILKDFDSEHQRLVLTYGVVNEETKQTIVDPSNQEFQTKFAELQVNYSDVLKSWTDFINQEVELVIDEFLLEKLQFHIDPMILELLIDFIQE